MNYTKSKIALGMVVVMLCVLVVPPRVHAGGVAVQFADVVLSKLEPGGVYNLLALRGLTFTVLNNYEETRDFQVLATVPLPGQLDKGYEPIPDPSWVKIVPDTFRLAHREDIRCAIIISIPEDEQYRGRHFQVMLLTTVKPDPFAKGVSLVSRVEYRLRFSVGIEAPKTIEERKKKERFLTLNFRLEPESLYIRDVEPGREIKLGENGIPALKVVNLGPEKVILRIKSVPCEQRFGIVTDYERTPNPDFLKCTKDAIKVKSNRIMNLPLVMKIPDEPEYRGKKYAFIIVAELRDTEVPLEIYSRVYVQIKE
jgi:hypothetical protein